MKPTIRAAVALVNVAITATAFVVLALTGHPGLAFCGFCALAGTLAFASHDLATAPPPAPDTTSEERLSIIEVIADMADKGRVSPLAATHLVSMLTGGGCIDEITETPASVR